jgi:prevent-host-death family protein
VQARDVQVRLSNPKVRRLADEILARRTTSVIDWFADQFLHHPMTSVGSYAAKTHLPELLARASRGEKILITRRGLPIALLAPPPRETVRDVRGVIARMKMLRRGNTLGSHLTIRDLVQEGRRF